MDVVDLVAAVIRSLVRSRVVQFLVIGAVIFALAPRRRDDLRISLRGSDLDALHTAQAQRLGVPTLSDDGRAAVDRHAIEDELLYREAVRLGLDRIDSVVRRHLAQKMLILAEDLADATREPTHEQLAAYFDRTRERWHLDGQLHLMHVFAVRRDTLIDLDGAVRATPQGVVPVLGDAFPHARELRGGHEDIAATYGEPFADAVAQLPVGEWSMPIESRFGWHVVRIVDHSPRRAARLDEVVDQLRLAFTAERRSEATAQFLTKAFARYVVEIDGTPVTNYRPTVRLGLRATPSGED